MKREEVIKIICDSLDGNYPLISSTGLISREIFNRCDYDSHFYMVGSMGLASAIGLGLALNTGEGGKIFILEGDASILMGLNNISNIALHQPKNLVHLVLDNNAFESCSEEKTASHHVRIDKIASAAGYQNVFATDDAAELIALMGKAMEIDGPIFILIRTELGGRRDLPRPLDLPDVAVKFRKFILKRYEKNNTK